MRTRILLEARGKKDEFEDIKLNIVGEQKVIINLLIMAMKESEQFSEAVKDAARYIEIEEMDENIQEDKN